MEGVRCARTMYRGIRQWIDNLQLLDNRAGPSVRDNEGQGIVMFRTNMNEMNVQPVDLGDELREGFQLRLALAPVVIGRPIAGEFLHRRELDALRLIGDCFPFRPLCRANSLAQVGELRVRNTDLKWTHSGLSRDRHVGSPSCDDGATSDRLVCTSSPVAISCSTTFQAQAAPTTRAFVSVAVRQCPSARQCRGPVPRRAC